MQRCHRERWFQAAPVPKPCAHGRAVSNRCTASSHAYIYILKHARARRARGRSARSFGCRRRWCPGRARPRRDVLVERASSAYRHHTSLATPRPAPEAAIGGIYV
eukprot:scaffold7377_cov389-Prasinococcus_capsulatus_cf.AAC.16